MFFLNRKIDFLFIVASSLNFFVKIGSILQSETLNLTAKSFKSLKILSFLAYILQDKVQYTF